MGGDLAVVRVNSIGDAVVDVDRYQMEFVQGTFQPMQVEGGKEGRGASSGSDRFAFELFDSGGKFHRVRFHRVREVYRNERCIWSRDGDSSDGASD
jgi:hypothetical protein